MYILGESRFWLKDVRGVSRSDEGAMMVWLKILLADCPEPINVHVYFEQETKFYQDWKASRNENS